MRKTLTITVLTALLGLSSLYSQQLSITEYLAECERKYGSDADLVIFIHRPEKYDIYEDEQGNSLVGLAEIILAKHRNGPIGNVQLKFKDESAKFLELETLLPLQANDEDDGSAFTVGSKMNQEGEEEVPY